MVSNLNDLDKRLRYFGINGKTKSAINGFLPVMLPKMNAIAERFYGYTLNFPEAQTILAPHYANKNLQQRQVKHWVKLFSCRFDEEFYMYSLNIGKIHYINKVYPYLYIGGYSYIQCELVQLASNQYSDPEMRTSVLTAISRLIALDMDLALTAYTREHWLQIGAEIGSPKATSKRAGEAANTVFVC